MEQQVLQAYARLTVHEFAIEVMFANWLASLPADKADEFLSDFSAKMRVAWTADPSAAGDDQTMMLLRDAAQMAENLAGKVARRAVEIRAKLDHK